MTQEGTESYGHGAHVAPGAHEAQGGPKRLKIAQKLRSWAQAGPQGYQKHPLAPKSHQNLKKIDGKLLRALVEKFAVVTPLRKLFRGRFHKIPRKEIC